jgi:biopolymer transport protein ExbD
VDRFSPEDFFSDDYIQMRKSRRQTSEMNLYPIIDMMATIIVFLVVSTSFTAFTKHTLPPSGVSTLASQNDTKPLQPMLMIAQRSEEIVLDLSWQGASPSSKRESVSIRGLSDAKISEAVRTRAGNLVAALRKQFPSEKTLQIGFSSESKYQLLISAMDGVQPEMPDVVLLDYFSVDARL